jgi:hypothetical protein
MENKKLTESEVIDLVGQAAVYGPTDEYTYYMSEGFLYRSDAGGRVELFDPDLEDYIDV